MSDRTIKIDGRDTPLAAAIEIAVQMVRFLGEPAKKNDNTKYNFTTHGIRFHLNESMGIIIATGNGVELLNYSLDHIERNYVQPGNWLEVVLSQHDKAILEKRAQHEDAQTLEHFRSGGLYNIDTDGKLQPTAAPKASSEGSAPKPPANTEGGAPPNNSSAPAADASAKSSAPADPFLAGLLNKGK